MGRFLEVNCWNDLGDMGSFEELHVVGVPLGHNQGCNGWIPSLSERSRLAFERCFWKVLSVEGQVARRELVLRVKSPDFGGDKQSDFIGSHACQNALSVQCHCCNCLCVKLC